MKNLRFILTVFLLIFSSGTAHTQDDTGLVKIKIRRIVFKAGNQYSVNIPDLEFHVLLQKSFDTIRSAVSADYDYHRKDMGFGMSHSLSKFVVNPGISVDDNLYFREVFNDSTGIWSRKQSITPFLIHEMGDKSSIGMNLKIEKEWSPKRRMGADIISYYDFSVKVFYFYHYYKRPSSENSLFTVSIERSYKILKGQYNYLLLESFFQITRDINVYVQYKGSAGFQGNLTPQHSPLFFIGGNKTLLGYEKDEFWGRRIFYSQNLFQFKPFPKFRHSIGRAEVRKLSFLFQLDFGRVRGVSSLKDLKPQDDNFKIGIGAGFGVNTDLPFMPGTDLHFMIASPSDDVSNIKLYAGFGGWLN